MFGKRLKSIRAKNKFTQQSMANSLNITLRTYQRYEGGDYEPSLDTLVAIADLLDVSIDILACRDNWLASHGVSADEYL